MLKITKNIILILLFVCFKIKSTQAQAVINKKLSQQEFINIVQQYHPVATQARLLIDMAKANLLENKGAFDPILDYDGSSKEVGGNRYYYRNNAQLVVPTWYGPDLVFGLQNNGWDRLDSELTPGASNVIGVNIPLLKNLFLDKRRAAIQQGKLLVNVSEQDRVLLVNELLYEAIGAYWNWAKEYEMLNATNNIVSNNKIRLGIIKKQYEQGDRAAIDTLDAFNQLQSMQYTQSQAYQDYINACYQMGNFLWINDTLNFIPDSSVTPTPNWMFENVGNVPMPINTDGTLAMANNHPKIRSLSIKQEILDVDRRLKRFNLLPKLDLKYNMISKNFNSIGKSFLTDNHAYGLGFNVPLFQRAARGQLQAAKIKLKGNSLESRITTVEINNKINISYNNIIQSKTQVLLMENILANSKRLLTAEETRFNLGESSMFVVNSRENKVLESNLKLIEARTKFYKNLMAYDYAQGVLFKP